MSVHSLRHRTETLTEKRYPFEVIEGGLRDEVLSASELTTMFEKFYDFLSMLDLESEPPVMILGKINSKDFYLRLKTAEEETPDVFIKATKRVEPGFDKKIMEVSYTFNFFSEGEHLSAMSVSLSGSKLNLKEKKPLEACVERFKAENGQAFGFQQPLEVIEADEYVQQTVVILEVKRTQCDIDSTIK